MTKTIFVYYHPHYVHKAFAESINADFWYYHKHFKKIPYSLRSILNGFKIPNYDFYLCEGGAPLLPTAIKKIISKKGKIIELVADETFLMLNNIPPEMKKIYNWKTNLAHKFAMRYIDGAIAVSKFIAESIKEFLDIPVRIVYPFIKEDLYNELAKINPNLERFNIVSIGYGEHKGMNILIKAFEIVKKEIEEAELFIIGKGHPKSWEKINGVHVLGYVESIIPYLQNASLYVQSSLADPFPVATLEALRAGLPCIVTEMTGTKEVVEKLDKKFVTTTNPEDIAETILLYYLDLSLSKRKKLSKKARELSEPFNKEKMCKRFKEEYVKLIEEI